MSQSLQTSDIYLGIQAYLTRIKRKDGGGDAKESYVVNSKFRALTLTCSRVLKRETDGPETLSGTGETAPSAGAARANIDIVEEEDWKMAYCIVPLALWSDWLIQVFLTAVAEALNGLCDAAQRAVNLLGVHVLSVVLHHAVQETNTH